MSREDIIENGKLFLTLGRQGFCRWQKALTTKGKNDKLDFIKIKTVCSQKTLLRKWKVKLQTEKNYSQIIHLTKSLFCNMERTLPTQ